MKNILTIIFLIWNTLAFAQPNVDSLLIETEPGKQFMSLNLETNPSLGKSYYAIIPPVFETYFDTIPQIKTNIPIDADIEIVTNTFEIKSTYYEWKQRTIEDTLVYNYLKDEQLENSEFLLFLRTEVPAQYQTTTSCSKEHDIYNEYITVEKKRLISYDNIQKLSSKDEVFHPNQVVIEVSNGKWDEFREVIISVRSSVKISDIQKALNKKGYKCEINGILDTETKAALVRFQKDNGIPLCCKMGCNDFIFRKLGLPGY
jgi:hypothetical protein